MLNYYELTENFEVVLTLEGFLDVLMSGKDIVTSIARYEDSHFISLVFLHDMGMFELLDHNDHISRYKTYKEAYDAFNLCLEDVYLLEQSAIFNALTISF